MISHLSTISSCSISLMSQRLLLLVLFAFLLYSPGNGQAPDAPAPVIEGIRVGHDGTALPTSHVHVRLGTVARPDTMDLRVFGTFNDFSHRQEDAVFAATVPSPGDSLTCGVVGPRPTAPNFSGTARCRGRTPSPRADLTVRCPASSKVSAFRSPFSSGPTVRLWRPGVI